MDSTHNPAAEPTDPRAILVTLAMLVCGNIGFMAGIFAGLVGHLSIYASTATGAGAFTVTLPIGLAILAITGKGRTG